MFSAETFADCDTKDGQPCIINILFVEVNKGQCCPGSEHQLGNVTERVKIKLKGGPSFSTLLRWGEFPRRHSSVENLETTKKTAQEIT